MPYKAHPTDWERLFGPRAGRRYGPVALFVILTLTLALLALLVFGARVGAQRYRDYQAALALTATPLWAQYYAQQTATAQAAAPQPATAPTPTALPAGRVLGTANLRSEPRVAPETVLGVLNLDDQVAILERQELAGQVWYRVQVTRTSGALAVGSEGWINGALLEAR
ncbi:SH3 domain-containing protein [Kallotenue papyrolyticum]|uniref:SH3 domain-containing protein n=1 Tax=Kallotenue papyrolyticum TaxID=1325125 RepID=UPI000492E35F|nr:SH3 domain-containing protein [Kallotenue papyrolyticum]